MPRPALISEHTEKCLAQRYGVVLNDQTRKALLDQCRRVASGRHLEPGDGEVVRREAGGTLILAVHAGDPVQRIVLVWDPRYQLVVHVLPRTTAEAAP